MSCARLFEPVDAAHLEACAECRAVQAALSAPAAVVPDARLERLKAAATKELQLNPRARPWFAGAIGLVAICAIAAALAMQLFPANTTQHASMTLRQVSAAAWAMTMLAGSFLAVMPGARGARIALLAGVGACFVVTLLAASGYDPGAGGIGCALTEWVIALLPFGVALAVLTGFAFDVTRALAGGVAAMSAGMLAVHLHCPNGTLQHQAMFHLAPIVLLAAVGLALRSMLPSRTHAP